MDSKRIEFAAVLLPDCIAGSFMKSENTTEKRETDEKKEINRK